MTFGKCEEVVKDRRFTLKERQAKITFVNGSKAAIRKVQIDNCVITEGLRCDWLLIDPAQSEYYVELKGSNMRHAIKQLKATMARTGLAACPKRYCFIIGTRCTLSRTEIRIETRYFMRDYNSTLLIKSSSYEHEI